MAVVSMIPPKSVLRRFIVTIRGHLDLPSLSQFATRATVFMTENLTNYGRVTIIGQGSALLELHDTFAFMDPKRLDQELPGIFLGV